MSEFRDAQRDIVADREVGTVETCRNLTTGATFYAEYEEITPLELLTDLGTDPREAAMLHVSDRLAAAAIASQTQIEILLYGAKHTFTVIERVNNPGSPQVDFKLKYNVPGKE